MYQSTWSDVEYSRYELQRPELDMDLGFDIRVSDALAAHFLLNVNPRREDVQGLQEPPQLQARLDDAPRSPTSRSRSSTATRSARGTIRMHLVGNLGVYGHRSASSAQACA